MIFQPSIPLPYSLHDMRVNGLEVEGDSLRLCFAEGYVETKAPFHQVAGDVILEGVDFDFAHVYLLSDNGSFGRFRGRKLPLLDFIRQYPAFSFEIVDETYGYNQVNYGGYLTLPGREALTELYVTIYYTGNMIYQLT